jgi:hypothetical protein
VADHLYVFHTLDSETDAWALLRVLELDRDGGMVFAWRSVPAGPALDVLLYPETTRLRAPRARLVVRAGHGGGKVHLDATKSPHVEDWAAEAPDASQPSSHDEGGTAWAEGGRVPPGTVFLAERVDYVARCDGDRDQSRFAVSVGPYRIVEGKVLRRGEGSERLVEVFSFDRGAYEVRGDRLPVRGSVAVHVPIRGGQETRVFVVAAHFAVVDATVTGRFVPVADLPRGPEESVDPDLGDLLLRPLFADRMRTDLPLDVAMRAWFERLLTFEVPLEVKDRVRMLLHVAPAK